MTTRNYKLNNKVIIYLKTYSTSVWSPEIGKFVVENWCYLPGIYTFGEEAEILEIFSKKL